MDNRYCCKRIAENGWIKKRHEPKQSSEIETEKYWDDIQIYNLLASKNRFKALKKWILNKSYY